MIKIITGEANSGKSTRFLQLYKESEDGIGLYSRKAYDRDIITGYDLVLLPNEEELPYISLKETILQEDIQKYEIQGRFAFLKNTFKLGELYIYSYPPDTPLWVDEIGGLEVKGSGYDSLLQTILPSGRDIVLTIRDYWLDKVIEKYNISDYELLNVGDKM